MNKVVSLGLLFMASLYCNDCSEGACTIPYEAQRSSAGLRFKAISLALRDGEKEKALYLIGKSTQEELSMQDYAGRTLLMIAIETGHEEIALRLVELMDKSALLIFEDDEQSAFGYASFYKMRLVADAISKKIF